MSKMGNHVVEMQESESYRLGWEAAERGDERPQWDDHGNTILYAEKSLQQASFDAYHSQEQSR